LGCRICYNTSGAADADQLSKDDAKAILDSLAGMSVFTVAFGGGEPLARADIFELAQYARARGLTPTMTTDGYFVDEETARRCRVFDNVHVSVDGLGQAYQALRGVGAFEYADRAIRLLKRSHITVGVNCVVSRVNFDHLDELVRYLRSIGVRDVIFLRLKPARRAVREYECNRLTPEQAWDFYAPDPECPIVTGGIKP
jgi:MoaA/NifB/PqqE/SkfB family radical SAM enzyme